MPSAITKISVPFKRRDISLEFLWLQAWVVFTKAALPPCETRASSLLVFAVAATVDYSKAFVELLALYVTLAVALCLLGLLLAWWALWVEATVTKRQQATVSLLRYLET